MLGLYIALGVLCFLALVFFLWLFLIAAKRNPEIDRYVGVKFAHRGLHGDFLGSFSAENSLSAFKKAAELGFGIELDVRLSKDGEVVVFHDNTLDRVTNKTGKVIDYTAKELSELSLDKTEEGVPTFREVLDAVGGRVPLLVEIKEEGFDHSVVKETVKLLEGYTGDFIIESFNPLSLGEVKKLMPKVPRGFLCDRLTKNPETRSIKYRLIQRHLLNFIARPAFIASSKDEGCMFPIPLIRKLSKPAFFAWTIRSEEEEEQAYADGFGSVIFENYIPKSVKR